MKAEWTGPVITATIAGACGLILSFWNIVANIKIAQRHLSITLERVITTSSQSPFYAIRIRNVGIINVTINDINIRLSDGFNFPVYYYYMRRPSNIHFPYELGGGKDCLAGVDIGEFAKILIQNGHSGKIKFATIITDGASKTYRSKKSIVLDLNEYNKA